MRKIDLFAGNGFDRSEQEDWKPKTLLDVYKYAGEYLQNDM